MNWKKNSGLAVAFALGTGVGAASNAQLNQPDVAYRLSEFGCHHQLGCRITYDVKEEGKPNRQVAFILTLTGKITDDKGRELKGPIPVDAVRLIEDLKQDKFSGLLNLQVK